MGQTSRAKIRSSWRWQVYPSSRRIRAEARPYEVMLVEATLTAGFVGERSGRLIAVRVYSSDVLDTAVGGET